MSKQMENAGRDNESSRDDRLAEVIEQFLAASDNGEPVSRTALLEQHPDLADDLMACLETLDFIGHSLGQGPATSVLECGQQFGEYQILRELGRGGMGVVYEAYHLRLERRVALKVLSGRSFEDDRQRERFLQEAKTAAGLHHTNIVPIYEVGELDGVCYYAMQFIAGLSLGAIVRGLSGRTSANPPHDITIFPPGTIVRDERHSHESQAARTETKRQSSNYVAPIALSDGPVHETYFREVARIVAQAADALAHAHAHGIVHRDVKPSNFILDREGRVWVTDFGLAFRRDDPDPRGALDAVGTPAYMSPEQVRPGTGPVDHRTDIYSLGATLYELLALRPIFEGDTSLSILTQIASVEPLAPRRLNSRVPADLDCIVRRAIAKRPEERYESAAAMGAELKRYLDFQPVHARQLGPTGRLRLWCRREPWLAAVVTSAAALLILVSIVSHWAILRARNAAVRARDSAEEQLALTKVAEAKALENYRQSLFQQARATSLSFQNGRRWATLDLVRQAQQIRSDPTLRDEAITALSIHDARLSQRLIVDSNVERLAFCPHERRIAFSCRDGSVRLWNLTEDPESAQAVTVLAASGHDSENVAFSACGRYLAAVEVDGPINVWDTVTGHIVARLETTEFRPRFLAFLGNQTWLAALSSDGLCRRWQWIDNEFRAHEPIEMTRWNAAIAGPHESSVTVVNSSGDVEIWDIVSGENHTVEGISLGRIRSFGLAWDPAGKLLAAAQRPGTVDLWNVGLAQPTRTLGGHRRSVRAIAFNPRAPLLATSGSGDPALKLWDLTTGDLLAMLREPLAGSLTAGFSPDGRYLAAGGFDKTIWLWEVETPQSFKRLAGHEDITTQVAISPDGNHVASGSADGSILLWHSLDQPQPVVLLARSEDRESQFRPNACAGLAFSQDGRLLAARSRNGLIRVWDIETREIVASLTSGLSMWSGGGGFFVPNSEGIIRSAHRSIQRWDFRGVAKPVTVATASDSISGLALSADGTTAAVTTGRNESVEIFDLATGTRRGEPIKLAAPGLTLSYSPDGRRLAVGDRSGTVHLIDLATVSLVKSWKQSDDELTSVAFSGDSARLGITSLDGHVWLLDASEARVIASLPGHEGGARSLVFGPNDSTLITCGDDKLVHVWRLDSLNQELASLGLGW